MLASRLRRVLEQEVPQHPRPRIELEQYRTPPEIAIELASKLPSSCGVVLDLGTGTGMIAYAASLLGGHYVIGIDVDDTGLEAARSSSLYAIALVDFVAADVQHLPLRRGGYCVVQNPPFGTRRRGADRVFVEAAASTGAWFLVSLHLYSSTAPRFLQKLYKSLGYRVELMEVLRFPIRQSYRHHFKRIHYASVLEVAARRVEE